jgi:oxygen-independent coproporphyrinogen III oxidase
MMDNNEVSLYIHIPFCRSKCYYCDFNSYAGMEELMPAYFEALKKELVYYSKILTKYSIGTIFIGGGTPSAVEKEYIVELMKLCRDRLNISDSAEISIETNPGTLDYDKLSAYRDSGINRLSMGLQAWQGSILKKIGRIHNSSEFEENLIAAKKAGFQNLNVDLIFGLPGQKEKDWEETLERVVDLGVEHISCYSLKIEEGTPFGDRLEKGEISYMDDELDRKMYYKAIEFLAEKGFNHYEISNFAKPGFECRHNLVYWKVKPYIGIGAGSHSYFDEKRFNNINSVEEYVKYLENNEIPKENIEVIDKSESISEYIILGLRLTEGIGIREFKEIFNENILEIYKSQIEKLINESLLVKYGDRLKLTAKGLDLANKVFVEFI